MYGTYNSRTKTYVAFDGDSDLMSYRTLQAWHAAPSVSFELRDAHEINYARDDSLPDSIKAQLQDRLDQSRNMILLVSEATRYNRKGILKYEINYALRNALPIVLVFIGYSSDTPNSSYLWTNSLLPKIPGVLKDADRKYCLISPFTRASVANAINRYDNLRLPDAGYTWAWL